MTHEEAIKGLKNLFSEYELDLPYTDSLEILHLSIEAIEKQIPKKPDDYYEDSLDDECAVCGTIIFERDRYCPRCGQAIDWE